MLQTINMDKEKRVLSKRAIQFNLNKNIMDFESTTKRHTSSSL